jgi:hypothetical protein
MKVLCFGGLLVAAIGGSGTLAAQVDHTFFD